MRPRYGVAVTLADYLDEAQLSGSQFAKKIGVSRQAVQRYLKGRIPEPDVMRRIALATASRVTANDFFGMAA
jgi:transcriptional regulator with XRE-family HTH domain